ncbi:SDR family NAD(P)-dependent oxidoreductase [Nonomuraea sp. CA-218870]|uniref:SDR family NAD(P)-dependent oxidoreductase n=1 Tax=Nonomuraea sp. CA-218870 TaxID=3239998 RepID=UPI003D8BB787
MTGVARWSAFVGSKAALRELADSLREEEAAHGIRVTTVYPGPRRRTSWERSRMPSAARMIPRRVILGDIRRRRKGPEVCRLPLGEVLLPGRVDGRRQRRRMSFDPSS